MIKGNLAKQTKEPVNNTEYFVVRRVEENICEGSHKDKGQNFRRGVNVSGRASQIRAGKYPLFFVMSLLVALLGCSPDLDPVVRGLNRK